jgi:transglutaminase-like putative cysteine protease
MTMKQPVDYSLTPDFTTKLTLIVGLALLPHINNLPITVSLYLLLLIVWRISSLYWIRLQPGRWLLLGITLFSIAMIYHQHQTLIGRDAGVALLCIMLMLKVMEIQKRRDIYVSVFISYFVVITQFLFSQSLLLTLYLILSVAALSALLMEINRVVRAEDFFQPLLKSIQITGQALPIAILLFIIFPRITEPLWGFGSDSSARTGLSDRVSPGSISDLIESSEVAFRAEFKQPPPPVQQRYWRALVLWDTDGYSWFNDKQRPLAYNRTKLVMIGQPIRYEIFLEPHDENWLVSLDVPLEAPASSRLTYDFQLINSNPLTQPKNYSLHSLTQYVMSELPPLLRQRALKLGETVTRQQQQLVAGWQADSQSDREIVARALRYFNNEPFIYTLSPPTYLNNPVDEFLFQGRAGFCEHYATSFNQLMRIAGIPSRLVLGYQGGEYNELGGYYIIRQYHAHAWSEVWLEDRGWIRVDPTAAVAPERIEYPLRLAFGEEGEPALFEIESSGLAASMIRHFTHALDNANIQWRRWIIGYSKEHQFTLIRNFGLDSLTTLQWALFSVGLVAIILLIVIFNIIRQGKVKLNPTQQLYQNFCNKLSPLGLIRRTYEGPKDFAARAARNRPDLAQQIMGISELYIALRYAPNPHEKEQQRQLARLVRQFRPRRKTGHSAM